MDDGLEGFVFGGVWLFDAKSVAVIGDCGECLAFVSSMAEVFGSLFIVAKVKLKKRGENTHRCRLIQS